MRAILVALLLTGQALAGEITGPARVVDGDTLWVGEVKVRLHGIDAPEKGQDYGNASTSALRLIVGGQVVSCAEMGRDRYGRTVARCTAAGVDVGREMVRSGSAWAFRRYSSAYIRDEEEARQAGRGLWCCQPVAPWEWRRKGN